MNNHGNLLTRGLIESDPARPDADTIGIAPSLLRSAAPLVVPQAETASGSILAPEIGTGIKIAYLHVGFIGPDFNLSMQLGLSDGTVAGSTVVDIDTTDTGNGNFGAAPDHITAVGTNFLFFATDHAHGRELWVSDGTSAGTQLVKDINAVSPTASHSSVFGYNNPAVDTPSNQLAVLGNNAYFTATDGTHGFELWKSDGTAAGTSMVADIVAGSGSSGPASETAFNGRLYFTVNDQSHPGNIWSTDGTTVQQETHLTAGANPDINSNGQPGAFFLTASGGHLFFDWSDATNDLTSQQLYVLDSSAPLGATKLTTTAIGEPANFKDIDGTLYFAMNDGVHGQEVWKSDGTVAGTVMVADIAPGGGGNNAPSSQPYSFAKMGSWIYFAATDGTHGTELWKTDGQPGGTTVMVKDIGSFEQNFDPSGSSFPNSLTVVGDTLYFSATDGGGGHGVELWKSDGTEAGTVMVKDIFSGLSSSSPTELQNVNGTLYFEAYDPTSQTQSIWKTDGTDAGTVLVANGTNGGYNPFAVIAPQPAVAHNDAFSVAENATVGTGLSVFTDNGSGADSGSGFAVTAINGTGASVGQQVTLASGAHLTLNADGTFSYDPNHAFDYLAAPASGATDTSATDSFTYTITGGATATVTVTVGGVDSDDTLIVGHVSGPNSMRFLDGGVGEDTAVFDGNFSTHAFGALFGHLEIDNIDLVNVEHYRFDDSIADITYSGSALDTFSVSYNDGSSFFEYISHDADRASWDFYHDTAGNLSLDISRTRGGRWVNTYDPTGAQPWAWTSEHYDSNNQTGGNLIERTVMNDDGTYALTVNDVANQYGWTTFTLSFDANGNQTGVTATRDDNSHTISKGEISMALDTTLWFSTPYDPAFRDAPFTLPVTGGTGNDTLYGFGGDDSVTGGGGNDLIVGGQGNDTLTGGTGNDHFLFHAGDGLDTITDFTHGQDVIDLHGYGVASFAALQGLMTQSGGDTIVTFDPWNTITLHDVTMGTLTSGDFLLS